jgi:hypothetical protein
MFTVITNIYNEKTKGPTTMELFTATGKLKKLFFTSRDDQCVHHGWHTIRWCNIQVLSTHTSTWVHRYSSASEYRYTHVDMCAARTCILYQCVPCHPWCTHWTSRVVKKLFDFSCGCEQFHYGRSFGFLVINVCNQGEHYETPCITRTEKCILFTKCMNCQMNKSRIIRPCGMHGRDEKCVQFYCKKQTIILKYMLEK